jgi:hypothetical protein
MTLARLLVLRLLRWFAVAGVAFAALLPSARVASANVSIVMDPSPPFSGVLVAGDFSEPTHGANEQFQFNGEARNDTAAAMRLLVRARANGAGIAVSQQVFQLAPNAVTSFSYSYTRPGPSPATVGLEFEAPDGTVSFVAGVFNAGPLAAVPALGSLGIAALAGVLALLGFSFASRRATSRVGA